MAHWVQHHEKYNFTPEYQGWMHTNADVYSNEVKWQPPLRYKLSLTK
jgi:hypothetical protein